MSFKTKFIKLVELSPILINDDFSINSFEIQSMIELESSSKTFNQDYSSVQYLKAPFEDTDSIFYSTESFNVNLPFERANEPSYLLDGTFLLNYF